MSALAQQDRGGAEEFPVFDLQFRRCSRSWEWRVCASSGRSIMGGRTSKRSAARYEAARALFVLLLSAPRALRSPESADPGAPERT